MKNTIKIIEQNNTLSMDGEALEIVSHNSNYELEFTFDEAWENCSEKTAIFAINGEKIPVKFEGNTVDVPVLQNAPYVDVSLETGDGDGTKLSTTSVRLEMYPTTAFDEMPDLEPAKTYLQDIQGAINGVKNGTIVSKNAEHATSAETAITASSALTSGTANVAKNVFRPNILINSNFVVNQRGGVTYTSSGYTVDRWNIQSTSTFVVSPNSSGKIRINNTGSANLFFVQYIENFAELAGKTLSYVIKVDGVCYTKSETMPETFVGNLGYASLNVPFGVIYLFNYSDNKFAFTVQVNAGQNIQIEYVKLEVGAFSTEYVAKTYSEELKECQRYFFKTKLYMVFLAQNATKLLGMINSPNEMRSTPILSYSGELYIHDKDYYQAITGSNLALSEYNKISRNMILSITGSGLSTNNLYYVETGIAYLSFDAEIK